MEFNRDKTCTWEGLNPRGNTCWGLSGRGPPLLEGLRMLSRHQLNTTQLCAPAAATWAVLMAARPQDVINPLLSTH